MTTESPQQDDATLSAELLTAIRQSAVKTMGRGMTLAVQLEARPDVLSQDAAAYLFMILDLEVSKP